VLYTGKMGEERTLVNGLLNISLKKAKKKEIDKIKQC
jgi:HSP20 family molecular chaperone IbpA